MFGKVEQVMLLHYLAFRVSAVIVERMEDESSEQGSEEMASDADDDLLVGVTEQDLFEEEEAEEEHREDLRDIMSKKVKERVQSRGGGGVKQRLGARRVCEGGGRGAAWRRGRPAATPWLAGTTRPNTLAFLPQPPAPILYASLQATKNSAAPPPHALPDNALPPHALAHLAPPPPALCQPLLFGASPALSEGAMQAWHADHYTALPDTTPPGLELQEGALEAWHLAPALSLHARFGALGPEPHTEPEGAAPPATGGRVGLSSRFLELGGGREGQEEGRGEESRPSMA